MEHFMKTLMKGLLLAVSLVSLPSFAADEGRLAEFRERVAKMFPGPLGDVFETPVPGLYEVVVGPQVFYMSEDGQYLVQGNIINLSTRENITEPRKAIARLGAVNAMGDEKMITYSPEKPEHTITVFTDIDCGYCRKLHRELKDYTDQGIRIRYVMFPRSGVNTESYFKAVSVWCAKDRQEAMTTAKTGGELQSAKCSNPIDEHMELGEAIGLRGTPAILLENGELIPGYVPAKRLGQHLSNLKAGKG